VSERKGLTAPANAAEELQRLMREETNEDNFIASLEGRKEALHVPSNEGVKEGRKEHSNEGTSAPLLGGTSAPSLEGAKKDRKETSSQGSREGRVTGWKEAVKVRAKERGKEDRKVRLNVDIPANLHLRLKMWCLREGYNLNELIPALVAEFMEGEG